MVKFSSPKIECLISEPITVQTNQFYLVEPGNGETRFYLSNSDGELILLNGASTVSTGDGQVAFGDVTGLIGDANFTFVGDLLSVNNVAVSNDPFGDLWNSNLTVPTKDALYDIIKQIFDSITTINEINDEAAQDAVGTILTDSSTIDFTYTDATPSITADVKDNSVTYAKIQNVTAASKLLGRGDSGSGDPEEITLGSGLSMTGTTLSVTGVGVSDGDKGDITVSSSGAVWTIDNDVVTFAKMQNVSSGSLLGRTTALSGDTEELTAGAGLTLSAGVLDRAALTGDVTASAGSNSTTIANNTVTYAKMQDVSAASRLIGRGSAAGAGDPQEITLGSGLAFTGTVLDTVGGGYTDEQAQDAVGNILFTSSTIEFVYDDVTPLIYAEIGDGAVTFAKIQGLSTNVLLGRGGTGGSPQEITLGTGLSISGTTLTIDSELEALAGLTSAANKLPYFTGSNAAALADYTASARTFDALTAAQGDLLYGSAAGTYSLLTKDTNATRYLANTGTTNNPKWDSINLANGVTGTLGVGNGGTGASTAADARTNLGLADGVYTPTLTGVANVASSTAYECQYMRIGNTVTVSGLLGVDATSASTLTRIGISLPIASNFGSVSDCGGTALPSSSNPNTQVTGAILADPTNDRAELQFISTSSLGAPNVEMSFIFMYQVI